MEVISIKPSAIPKQIAAMVFIFAITLHRTVLTYRDKATVNRIPLFLRKINVKFSEILIDDVKT